MKLERAIEILTLNKTHDFREDQDFIEALQLGIEAMKRLQDVRQGHEYADLPLPSETEEK